MFAAVFVVVVVGVVEEEIFALFAIVEHHADYADGHE